MKSFKIDGVLFELDCLDSFSENKQFSRNNKENKNLFIIIKDLYYKEYAIFNVNCIKYYNNLILELEVNRLIFESDGSVSLFQGSAQYTFFRKDILYYSSDFDLTIKKAKNLNLLS